MNDEKCEFTIYLLYDQLYLDVYHLNFDTFIFPHYVVSEGLFVLKCIMLANEVNQ